MPHHKKPRLNGAAADYAANRNSGAVANELSGDIVAIIFGFFPPKDIMHMRRVCKKWREAAKMTTVPSTKVVVVSVRSYNAMRVMTTALPNLQQLSINWGLGSPGSGHKYSDGEDPNEELARYHANGTSHNITIISNFKKLRVLNIHRVDLNGRYPVLFDFPLLHKLFISDCRYLKFDLAMLSGLPLLKELKLMGNDRVVGNLRSLRVLKDILEEVDISCHQIEGNFMDLADFPRLKQLDLRHTSVTGYVMDIGENGFPALEQLSLPSTVHGGMDYEFQRISDVPSFMQAVHLLMQRTPTLFKEDSFSYSYAFHWRLSEDSPDWYAYDDGSEVPKPPFHLQLVQAGSRLGWVWCSYGCNDEEYDDEEEDKCHSCEINWLDPEPSVCSSNYEAYIEKLHHIEERIGFYRGYSQPPTLAEYNQLCEEYPRYSD